jgi:hypothetical protein
MVLDDTPRPPAATWSITTGSPLACPVCGSTKVRCPDVSGRRRDLLGVPVSPRPRLHARLRVRVWAEGRGAGRWAPALPGQPRLSSTDWFLVMDR